MIMKKKKPHEYNREETEKIFSNRERLVYVDTTTDEIIIKYDDIPDVIVDISNKLKHNVKMKIYDFEEPDLENPLVTTIGYFLDKCNRDVRDDIMERLVQLQLNEIEVKDYKVINKDILEEVRNSLLKEEMER